MTLPENNSKGHPAVDGKVIRRLVRIGGLGKQQLFKQLSAAGVEFNEYARILFASDKFITLPTRQSLMTVEVAIHQFGFERGATLMEVYERAQAFGWLPAPIELGAHLRLQYLDQPEGYWGQPVTEHQAPAGSLTIAAMPLMEKDDEFPKGFYLRRIKGVLWLRGYCCARENIWHPGDRFIFYEPDVRNAA